MVCASDSDARAKSLQKPDLFVKNTLLGNKWVVYKIVEDPKGYFLRKCHKSRLRRFCKIISTYFLSPVEQKMDYCK